MTILITGGTGLVGTRLIPRLINLGYDCRVLARSGKAGPSGTTTVEGDILDRASLASAMDGVTAVVHLAAILRTPDPKQIWEVNFEGTRNLIAAATEHAPDARFIMASTGLVYSNSAKPAIESDHVQSGRAYPASKIEAEKLLQGSSLNWSILRFAFIYGDGDGHIGQIPLIAKLLQLHPANRLSMIHHRDIATFVKMGLDGVLDSKIVNAADDAPMAILDLSAMAGVSMEPVIAPLVNPWLGVMDVTRSQQLGFRPEILTTWQAAREGGL